MEVWGFWFHPPSTYQNSEGYCITLNFPSSGRNLHAIQQIDKNFETFLKNENLKLIPKNTIYDKTNQQSKRTLAPPPPPPPPTPHSWKTRITSLQEPWEITLLWSYVAAKNIFGIGKVSVVAQFYIYIRRIQNLARHRRWSVLRK